MNGHAAAASEGRLYDAILKRAAVQKSLRSTKQLHGRALASGSLSSHLRSALTVAYAACGCAYHARKLFDELFDRTLFLWNALMRMYSRSGAPREALHLFVEMLASPDNHQPDNFTYPLVIKACGDLSMLRTGVSVHARTFISGFDEDPFVQNSLLAMYMNCGEKKVARRVFDAMRERTLVSWNTMLSGYFRNGCAEQVLMVLRRLRTAGVEPDCATVVSALPACGYLKALDVGRVVHAWVEEWGLGGSLLALNSLVDMYAKCGRMDVARLVFNRMDERDVVTWTTMITGYIVNGDVRSALALCPMMQLEGIWPNVVTVGSLLSACAVLNALKHGHCLHGWALRQRMESTVIVETALIDMYAKCNRIDLSSRVFARTLKVNTNSWNAVLSGCIHNSLAREAIGLFNQMRIEEVEPNAATINSLVPAYAILADLQQAKNLHSYLIRSGFISTIEVATTLVDVYSKCGSLESAHKVFDGVPVKERDIFLWSVIIASYGVHGNGATSVSLFHNMMQSGLKPNEVTFTSVLHACSHAGLVDEGLDLFNLMLRNRHIYPHFDHYTCIVDLLGRAGRLREAYELIQTMPCMHNHAVWGALLGSCIIHGNVEMGEVAAKWLFELEPENTGNYVLLAQIYATAGRWKEAENVRHMMQGLRKTPAHSLI